jgi:hypothetical protein
MLQGRLVTARCKSKANSLAQRRIDATLRSHGVGPGREQLGYAGGVEASLGQAKGRTETGTTGTDDNCIVLVVNDGIGVLGRRGGFLCSQRLGGHDPG